jgi:hypothetical protein
MFQLKRLAFLALTSLVVNSSAVSAYNKYGNGYDNDNTSANASSADNASTSKGTRPLLRNNAKSKPQTKSLSLSNSFADTFPDKHLVLDMVHLSRDIYSVDEGVEPKDAISNPKFKFQYWIETEKSTEAMIVTYETEKESKVDKEVETSSSPIVVIFRGTEDYQDMKTDASLILAKNKFVNAPETVKIHSGFQHALFGDGDTDDSTHRDVIHSLEDQVLNLVGESGEVVITGHSLGGSNAHIMAVYLSDKYPNMKITMLNFGAPRVGNEAFKKWSESTLVNLSAWRYVNDHDMVPRMIPNSFGYDHAGHLFQIWEGDYTEVFYRQVGNGSNYAGAPWYWYYGTSAADHFVLSYAEHFETNIDNEEYWPTSFVETSVWNQIQQVWYAPKRVYSSLSEE